MKAQCSRAILPVPHTVIEFLDSNAHRDEPATLGRSTARIR